MHFVTPKFIFLAHNLTWIPAWTKTKPTGLHSLLEICRVCSLLFCIALTQRIGEVFPSLSDDFIASSMTRVQKQSHLGLPGTHIMYMLTQRSLKKDMIGNKEKYLKGTLIKCIQLISIQYSLDICYY